jgi:hypothetical protein
VNFEQNFLSTRISWQIKLKKKKLKKFKKNRKMGWNIQTDHKLFGRFVYFIKNKLYAGRRRPASQFNKLGRKNLERKTCRLRKVAWIFGALYGVFSTFSFA